MAITATATLPLTAKIGGATTPPGSGLPSGYVPPTLPSIVKEAGGTYTTDVSISESDAANPVTSITNILAALESHFETTYGIDIGLDPTRTIDANLTVSSILRTNTADSIFLTGVEVFRCSVFYQYEAT